MASHYDIIQTLRYITYIILHYITLHYIALHYITLHYITLHYIALHCITLHCITLHYIALHYIALHCITLHCIALHYIALHYIALHCNPGSYATRVDMNLHWHRKPRNLAWVRDISCSTTQYRKHVCASWSVTVYLFTWAKSMVFIKWIYQNWISLVSGKCLYCGHPKQKH
jgi:hypothetical protein